MDLLFFIFRYDTIFTLILNIFDVGIKLIQNETRVASKRSDLLLGIHPQHVKKILSAEKRIEFRRVLPSRPVSNLWIYETSPVSRIVGICIIDSLLCEDKEQLWRRVADFSGIDKKSFDAYFHDKKSAGGLMLSNPRRFSTLLTLHDIGIKGPPQGLVYLNDEHIRLLA